MTVSTLFEILGSFALTFVLSLTMGVSVGLISALIMKMNAKQTRRPVNSHRTFSMSIFENLTVTHQCGFLVLLAYLAYILAEALSLSGIVTLFFCGLTMSHYTYCKFLQRDAIALSATW